MKNWEIERDKKAERVKLLRTLKEKYASRLNSMKVDAIKKIVKENNLNSLEAEYIFFEDNFLQRIATI